MWGILHLIPAVGTPLSQQLRGHLYKHKLVVLNAPPSIEVMELALGKGFEPLKSFDTILHGGETKSCMVFHNWNHGSEPPNLWANLLWLQSLVRKFGFSEAHLKQLDILAGPVVIIWGDLEFMEQLSTQYARTPLPS